MLTEARVSEAPPADRVAGAKTLVANTADNSQHFIPPDPLQHLKDKAHEKDAH